MKTKIFFTTNAGLYFTSDNAEILIDGIHDAAAVGFPAMAPEMVRRMESDRGLFVGSGLLLFTHLHKDHYHAAGTRSYLARHPETAQWGPGLKIQGIGGIEETGSEYRFSYGRLSVTAYRTKHSGMSFSYIPHYSFLLRNVGRGEAFFVSGDAVLDPGLAKRIRKEAGRSVKKLAAFVTAYQLAEKSSRAFIEALKPARLFLIHQPLEGSEAAKTISGIMRLVRQKPPVGPLLEEPEPMHWIE